MAIRTTEQIAMETVPSLIHQLATLTSGQPTTAEIEEAIMTSRALTAALSSWASSRHLIGANAHMAAQFSETHPEVAEQMASIFPVETPEDAEELDRIEHAHPEPGFTLNLRDLA